MELQILDNIVNIIPDNYVILRFNGLYGDVIHGMCKLQYILKLYPNLPWIIIHDYPSYDRVKDAMDLFRIWINNGRIKYYFYNPNGCSGRIRPETINKIRQAGLSDRKLFDCYVFDKKPNIMTLPSIGIDIPNKRQINKAIIFRYSGYHGHFFGRNRPIEDWVQIERKLLDYGYDVYLLGKDDSMSNPNNLIDLRGKFTVRELLQFSSDSSICISVTTFLYIWTQFICPTLILSESGDVWALNEYWKLNDNLEICNINQNEYISVIFNFIHRVRSYV